MAHAVIVLDASSESIAQLNENLQRSDKPEETASALINYLAAGASGNKSFEM